MFSLDRESSVPLADQIENRLRAFIDGGQLSPGARLPSIRTLAAQLGVSPNTVVTAYDRLVAAACIDSHGTAGFFVSETAQQPGQMPGASLIEPGDEQEPVWLVQQANNLRADMLPASSGALPVAWLEDAVPAAVVQRALARSSGGLARRCPPQGLPELRERLAMLMRGQGLAVDASRVLTTYGSTHAIDLICRSFVQPGDAVLVEDPGYFLLFDRLRQAGARLVPIARRIDGPDVDQVEAACLEHRPRLMFLQSVLHNPTGWSSSAARLHRLLVLAEQHGFLIAEDDVHGHFHPGSPTRVTQLAELRRVIYYSSFCKALSPGLRLGYVAAEPALLKPLLREKIHSVLTTAALNEFVLLELLAAGRVRKHLDRLQQKLATARRAATKQLRQAGILLEHPAEGGLFLWGSVPPGVDVDELVKDAFRNGLLLSRGATFMADGRPDPHLRFNVVYSQHERLAGYLRERLGALSTVREVIGRAASKVG
jgi:DNA-binding transcriptional MocR family regulator